MPPRCVALGCKGAGAHRFPKDIKLRKLWLKAVRIKNSQAKENTKLCSEHFKPSDYSPYNSYGRPQERKFLRRGAIPTIFSWNNSKCNRNAITLTEPSTSSNNLHSKVKHEVFIPESPIGEQNEDVKYDISNADAASYIYVECLNEKISNDDEFDILGLCRACLSRNKTKLMAEDLNNMFVNITGLPNHERLPNVLCDVCERKLNESNEFKKQCLTSNQWLINKINTNYNSKKSKLPANENNGASVEISKNTNTINKSNSKTTKPNSSIIPNVVSSTNPSFSGNVAKNAKRKLVVRVLDKDTNKLVPVEGNVPQNIKALMAEIKKNRYGGKVQKRDELTRKPVNYNNGTECEMNRQKIKIKGEIKVEKESTDECETRDNMKLLTSVKTENENECFNLNNDTVKSNMEKKTVVRTKKDSGQIEYSDESSYDEEIIAKKKQEGRDLKIEIEMNKMNKIHSEGLNSHQGCVIPPEIMNSEKHLLDYIFDIREMSIEEQKAVVQKRGTNKKYLDKPYKCETCFVAYVKKEAYDSHMMWHTPKAGEFICEVCTRRSADKHAFHRHTKLHLYTYHCKFCPYEALDRVMAIEHINKLHGRTIKCELCSYTTTSKPRLRAHMQLRHPCNYFCVFCGYAFISKAALGVHVGHSHRYEEQDVNESWYCKKCDVTFMKQNAYDKHLKVSFQHGSCEEPNMKYMYVKKKDRENNRKTEHNQTTTVENENTEHTQESRICEWCGIVLQCWKTYYYHLKNIHPDKPNTEGRECGVCGKLVMRTLYLRHCIAIHNFMPKTHECDYCVKKFRWKRNLRKHLIYEHDMSDNEVNMSEVGAADNEMSTDDD